MGYLSAYFSNNQGWQTSNGTMVRDCGFRKRKKPLEDKTPPFNANQTKLKNRLNLFQ
jgi:hypothetical protein